MIRLRWNELLGLLLMAGATGAGLLLHWIERIGL